MNAALLRCAALAGALLLTASPALAQTARDSAAAGEQATSVALKSGTTATFLSVMLPGLGHFYAGENRTGMVLLALFAGAIAVGAAGENSTSGAAAILIGGGPWWYGVIDAHDAAARYNRAHATISPSVQVRPAVLAVNGAFRVGIALSVTH